MFSAIHPALLWGSCAVAVPVLIHLLLRQRPRPRPWAAMRWLLAAIQVAQRRYKLTNLLLLLLRCLIVLLIALAVARPNLAGIGSGGQLVLVIDCTASMGERGDDPGPLAQVKAALGRAELPQRLTVITVSDRTQVLTGRNAKDAVVAVERLSASPLPGGLDRAAVTPFGDEVLAVCGADADVVLISDFQQDDGELLVNLLTGHCRSLAKWAVGKPAANALVTGIGALPDLVPGQPGELLLKISGPVDGVRLAVDGGPATPALVSGGGDALRLPLPPLEAGPHRLKVELVDQGLAYDNLLELPLRVRPAVTTLAVQEQIDFLGAALAADTQQLNHRNVRPTQLATEPLPPQGLVALRSRVGDGQRLRAWVAGGGVLWATLDLLSDDPQLKELVSAVKRGEGTRPGGAFASGDKDIDAALSLGGIEQVANITLPESAEVLLRAGAAPLVAALHAGQGWVVVELQPLAHDQALEARGTTPLWVRRTVRHLTARVDQPRIWQAGAAAPMALSLRRAGMVYVSKAGEPLLVAPGLWSVENSTDIIVLASRNEGQIDKRPPVGVVSDLAAALPRRQGADWGLPLLIAALLMALGEGLLAAWAGRTYGR